MQSSPRASRRRAFTCAGTASRRRRLQSTAGRARLGVPDGATLELYVGRVAAGKGLEHLAAAAEQLPDAHVVVFGPDDRHGTAAVLERSPRVHVLPPTEAPPFDLYRAADVFVL